jgi:hypothetical protein
MQAVDAAAKAGVTVAPPAADYFQLRDINQHDTLRHRLSTDTAFVASVEPRGVVFLRLTPKIWER